MARVTMVDLIYLQILHLQMLYGHSNIAPSSGAQASTEAKDSDIHIVVNNESDLSIASPVGQVPTILGSMQCRVGNCACFYAALMNWGKGLLDSRTCKSKWIPKKFSLTIKYCSFVWFY